MTTTRFNLRGGVALCFVALLGILGWVGAASAQNIDLSTLPPREGVQLTIYNAEDLTLVRETRRVTVAKGVNELQFSWANTLIDPTSVRIRFPDSKSLELVDTRYPHDRPQALYWNVQSDSDDAALVEISYFTSGISWSADYEGVSEPSEESMRFSGFVTVTNNSGEDYADASVRLVVGSINLVEKIRDLAERGIVTHLADDQLALRLGKPGSRRELAETAVFDAVSKLESATPGEPGGGGFDKKMKEIVKEGLSEYFIFTVPGEETVKSGWSKRLRLFESAEVPVTVAYRYRPEEYGDQLVRLYLVRNDAASTLGDSPLPDGAVRLYRRETREGGDTGLAVTAFVTTKYVPIGQEFEFVLGTDPQVLLERIATRRWRDEFWFHSKDGKRLVSPTQGERIEPEQQVSGWTDHESRIERIRNYRGEPIEVEWRFPLEGDVSFSESPKGSLSATLHDYRSPRFSATVPASTTKEFAWDLARRQGSNAKQNAVRLDP